MGGSGISGNQGLQTLNQMASSSDSNPYLDAMYSRANNQVQSGLNANFSRAGRYGSGAHEAASADAANNLATQLYGGAYDSDQNRRLSAAQGAGQLYNQGIGQQILGSNVAQQLGNQAYTDASALSQAGGIMDDYNQQKINADIDRYNYLSLIHISTGSTGSASPRHSARSPASPLPLWTLRRHRVLICSVIQRPCGTF